MLLSAESYFSDVAKIAKQRVVRRNVGLKSSAPSFRLRASTNRMPYEAGWKSRCRTSHRASTTLHRLGGGGTPPAPSTSTARWCFGTSMIRPRRLSCLSSMNRKKLIIEAGVHQTPSRRNPARENQMQHSHLGASSCQGGWSLPDGRGYIVIDLIRAHSVVLHQNGVNLPAKRID